MQRKLQLATAIAATLAAGSATAQTRLDVQQQAVNAINNDRAAQQSVLKLAGVAAPDGWRVKAVKITRLKASDVQLKMPPQSRVPLTSTEIVNCDDTGTSRAVNLTKEVSNGTTVTKSQSFSQSIEASVSAKTFFGGASLTSTSTFAMNNERSESQSQSQTVADTVTVSFNAKGGRISVLEALRISGNAIPWTATFVPEDTDDIEITAESSKGQACIYLGQNYTGKSQCYPAGSEINYVGNEFNDKIWSVKVEGGVVATMFVDWHFSGKAFPIDRNVPTGFVVFPFPFSSLKVSAPTTVSRLKFSQLKGLLPVGARSFTVNGTVDISQTAMEGKRITNYVMPPADVDASCKLPPPTDFAAGSAASLKSVKPGGAVLPAGGVRTRTLNDDELARRLATARPG